MIRCTEWQMADGKHWNLIHSKTPTDIMVQCTEHTGSARYLGCLLGESKVFGSLLQPSVLIYTYNYLGIASYLLYCQVHSSHLASFAVLVEINRKSDFQQ